MLLGNQIGCGNVLVWRCQDRTVRVRKFAQVTACNLLGRSNPSGKMGNIVVVWNETERRGACFLKAQQQRTSSRDSKSVGWGLRQHAHESELGDCATRQSCPISRAFSIDPPRPSQGEKGRQIWGFLADLSPWPTLAAALPCLPLPRPLEDASKSRKIILASVPSSNAATSRTFTCFWRSLSSSP